MFWALVLRKRGYCLLMTPRSPRFSSMNSTPAASCAPRKLLACYSCSFFLIVSFAQSYAGTAAVFVDELDARFGYLLPKPVSE
jgi:hypothetical protein